jgi:benzoyl-CoA reductase/2-hydroxyglutaryl-CoA dehydratase subunit BcrC/BadD/HgdB
VGWLTSIFPQEIVEALDLTYVYPENHCAAVSARKEAPRFIEIAEDMGYSVDLCSYARLNLGYAEVGEAEAVTIPLPDFICCCNNICYQVVKWYENLSKRLNIPMIMIDIPFNDLDEPNEDRVKYIQGQLEYAIEQLEKVAGKKMDYDKLKEIMITSNKNSKFWMEATKWTQHTPSPMDGFSLFNYMALIVCARGKVTTAEVLELLEKENAAMAAKGESTYRGENQEYRVMYDGIAVWPTLGFTAKTLVKNGMNMVSSTYPDAFAIYYDDPTIEGMARGYSGTANTRNIEFHIWARSYLINEWKCDGVIYHMNRSCKIWDFMQYQIAKKTEEATGIPYTIFDGDQSDPRAFSQAQFETRIQGLREVMAQNKEKKRG